MELTGREIGLIKKLRNDSRRVLVVGDLHAPFIRQGYLEHCQQIFEEYNCNEVVFIGDLIDNHYSSYHEQDPDGYGAGEFLDPVADRGITVEYHVPFQPVVEDR